jgi:hypothetical protein
VPAMFAHFSPFFFFFFFFFFSHSFTITFPAIQLRESKKPQSTQQQQHNAKNKAAL